MAYENPDFVYTLEASGDLSASQFHALEVDSNGQAIVCNSAGVQIAGVLQNKPTAAGMAATVCASGITKVIAGAAVTAGAELEVNASGRLITATTGDVVAIALEDAAGDGSIMSVLLK